MGYVFDFHDAVAYDKWFQKPHNRSISDLETRLMIDMLDPARGESVIDIGCGTGASLLPFVEKGLQVTGIDPSPYMLDIAARNLGNRADLHRGFAEDLPFDDNSFNYAFVENPEKALEEVCRVTKDKIFLGVLNRYAIKGVERRIKGVFIKSVYNRATFFSIWELKQIIRDILGDVPISWRTISCFPLIFGNVSSRIERSRLIQRCPFGAFTGMVVTLVPRFRTRPLSIDLRAKRSIVIWKPIFMSH
ncbi:MAG: methyltransferase domain-containing protein [Deltaproteobacteria bacterium]|nr:methyltransferase domain-containing protein [Deltaproteobacteria bacterium]